MTKTIEVGKIAYSNMNRRANMADVKVCLSMKNGQKVFSASGNIWNTTHTKVIAGGQVLDEIAKHIAWNPVFREVHDLWKKYHLNDMHMGTRKQEAAVAEHFKKACRPYDGDEAVRVLKRQNLYIDNLAEDESVKCGGRNDYAYGTSWICYAIPEDDLKRIEKLFE